MTSMKKITIFLAALLLVFAAGCREDASLDGLESQTKEEGTSAGENAESIAVKEALTYESALEYNWVAEYAPAAGKSYTILFNFLSDSSVATDSPVSENEKNLALFSVSALKEGGVIIKFDGQIAYLIDTLHLSYTEVFEIIPYRNLLMMQRDKLHAVYGGQKVNRISGKELANRRKKK